MVKRSLFKKQLLPGFGRPARENGNKKAEIIFGLYMDRVGGRKPAMSLGTHKY